LASILAFSFQELLIIFAVSIFLVVLLLLIYVNRSSAAQVLYAEKLPSKRIRRVIQKIHYLLLVGFVGLGIYSIMVGVRGPAYFAVLSLIFVTSISLTLWNGSEKKKSLFTLVLLTIIVVTVFQALIPAAENRLMVFGADQWTYATAGKLISQTGTFTGVGYGDAYYSSIPLLSLLISAVTIFLGDVFVAITVITAVVSIVMVLCIYLILLKLSHNHVASVAAAFIFLSVPHLQMIQIIPSTLSIAFGSLLTLLLIQYLYASSRTKLTTILVVAFAAVVCHPAGIIILAGLCVGLIVFSLMCLVKNEYVEFKLVLGVLIVTLILSIIYWSSSDAVFYSMIQPFERLLNSLPASTGPSVYQPNYFQSGLELFSYAWALPVGVSSAYLIAFYYTDYRKKEKRRNFKGFLNILSYVAAVIGLLAIVFAFISVTNSPGASVERYADTPAYFLLVIPTSLACAQLIGSHKNFAQIVLITIVVVGLFLGASSPDWAPFESTQYGGVHYTYSGYAEAVTIVGFTKNNTVLLNDYDIGVDALAQFYQVPFGSTGSYQNVRDVLDSIKDGSFDVSGQWAKANATYIVRVDEIQNTTAIDSYFNLVYSSGNHVVFIRPSWYGYIYVAPPSL
jgi:hypothetical protein